MDVNKIKNELIKQKESKSKGNIYEDTGSSEGP